MPRQIRPSKEAQRAQRASPPKEKRPRGRPKGAAHSTAARELIALRKKLVDENGITPLEVMMEAMTSTYLKLGAISAFPYARECAPYIHARKQSTTLQNPDGSSISTVPPVLNVMFVKQGERIADGGAAKPADSPGE